MWYMYRIFFSGWSGLSFWSTFITRRSVCRTLCGSIHKRTMEVRCLSFWQQNPICSNSPLLHIYSILIFSSNVKSRKFKFIVCASMKWEIKGIRLHKYTLIFIHINLYYMFACMQPCGYVLYVSIIYLQFFFMKVSSHKSYSVSNVFEV